MFNHHQFSKDLKNQKLRYQEGAKIDESLIEAYLSDIAAVDLKNLLTDDAKNAFWINIYNGLINYWIIRKKIKKTMLERPFLVFCAKANIGGFRLSLDDIEHGILRGNKRSTYKLWRQFSSNSPQAKLAVQQMDYRIHFALNCGGKSCPPIAFYEAASINKQLQLAEENFVANEFRVDATKQLIECSKIFWLYRPDFVDCYINDPAYKSYQINYLPYDFSI